ncbi:hypothetical protein QE368_002518 [Asaia bogorensis NBRC 16594]|nr:hypothetical protein [Asaia bogorensis NBRC 16594]
MNATMNKTANNAISELVQNHAFGGPGNPGSADARALWLCGIEYGESPDQRGSAEEIEDYSVAMQWRNWTYNRNAFKLISAIEGQPVESAQAYAEKQKIFESKTAPYFQTNLFPVECHSLETWSEQAQARSGYTDKNAYIAAVRASCFALMHQQILSHKPRLFIGVGITHLDDFCRVVLGASATPEKRDFTVNGHNKTVYLQAGEIPFAVVPHLSSPNGLNSNEALQRAGDLIREIL